MPDPSESSESSGLPELPRWKPLDEKAKVVETPPVVKSQELTEAQRQKILADFSKFFLDLKAKPDKIFEKAYADSFDQETGEINLNSNEVLMPLLMEGNATLRMIIDCLASLGGTVNGFSFEIAKDSENYFHIKVVHAQSFIREAGQAKEMQAKADFEKLLEMVRARLEEVIRRPAFGPIGSDFFKDSDGRIVVRNWDREVPHLLNVLNDPVYKKDFLTIMEKSEYYDVQFGSVDDGNPQRWWIELSWGQKK